MGILSPPKYSVRQLIVAVHGAFHLLYYSISLKHFEKISEKFFISLYPLFERGWDNGYPCRTI
jgi:hypothetical protein